MDVLTSLPVQGGALAVALGGVLMIFMGRLVPRSTVDALREADKATIESQRLEIQEWRAAWRTADQSNQERDAHISDLVESARITEQILRSLTSRNGVT